ncbi:MAG: Trm112 family protein [Woeseiaceae bacterium]|nr:Trm112 family protein [Woeseiaceae bacterium]
MDKKLLAILCCPVTHRELAPARRELLQTVNDRIAAGTLVNRDGAVLCDALREALVTDDGKTLYPVRDGIPVLLEGEGVGLADLQDP